MAAHPERVDPHGGRVAPAECLRAAADSHHLLTVLGQVLRHVVRRRLAGRELGPAQHDHDVAAPAVVVGSGSTSDATPPELKSGSAALAGTSRALTICRTPLPYVEVNGQRIHYQDSGGPGLPLVLAHGLLMDHEMFAPQVAAFGDRHRVVTWDERGHGL